MQTNEKLNQAPEDLKQAISILQSSLKTLQDASARLDLIVDSQERRLRNVEIFMDNSWR
jgi:hypothetical protein